MSKMRAAVRRVRAHTKAAMKAGRKGQCDEAHDHIITAHVEVRSSSDLNTRARDGLWKVIDRTMKAVDKKCPTHQNIKGLGSSAEVHADQAERDTRDGFKPFMANTRVELSEGNCGEAYDALLSATRVFGAITADSRAAGLPYPQESLEELETEMDRFAEKCVRDRTAEFNRKFAGQVSGLGAMGELGSYEGVRAMARNIGQDAIKAADRGLCGDAIQKAMFFSEWVGYIHAKMPDKGGRDPELGNELHYEVWSTLKNKCARR